MRSTHSTRLERWLGAEQVALFSGAMAPWYGNPIAMAGVPGNVSVAKGGGFVGPINGGEFACLEDYLYDIEAKARRETIARMARRTRQFGGFATVEQVKQEAGKQRLPLGKQINASGVVGAWGSSWRSTILPVAGAAAAISPGGTVPTKASVGAIRFENPTTGTTHFIGCEGQVSTSNVYGMLLYDRIFAVAKEMITVAPANNAVTGVPTRYQSTTQGAEDSAENNFLFMECGTVLPATAHNWTVCTYTDQSGNLGATLPSVTGISSCAAGRLDMPLGTWFAPLATGDTGIQALTQMQYSAALASGAIDFVIGHPIAWIPSLYTPGFNVRDERINSAMSLARIFDDACLALLGVSNVNSSSFFNGFLTIGSA
jgi:hypothetical protein